MEAFQKQRDKWRHTLMLFLFLMVWPSSVFSEVPPYANPTLTPSAMPTAIPTMAPSTNPTLNPQTFTLSALSTTGLNAGVHLAHPFSSSRALAYSGSTLYVSTN